MSCPRARINLTGCEGATFERRFVWKTGNPAEPVDLTGYSGECHIRDKINDSEAVFVLADGVGVIFDDQVENPGGYRLFMSPDVTSGKCVRHTERHMVYDLRLVAPDLSVRLQQYGNFKLIPAVTRPWE